ncbi:MAG: TatD family hydrolase [Anaerolineae bacterium]|nr:TatD family hydrolase [Anaerolineae bacterium]
MRLIDTHCHLYFDQFSEDLEEVLQRAAESGVEKMIVPGISLETSREAVRLAERYDPVYAAVGIHPNSGSEWDENAANEITELAGMEKVVAIGEIGLDNHWETVPVETQERVFQEQLELSAKLDKPVIIHSRESTGEVLGILERWLRNEKKDIAAAEFLPGVLHSYSGDEEECGRAIEMGFFIGIAGPVTFKNALDLQKIVAGLPLEKVLIETDSPYLSPHPHRGKRNEPQMVGLVNGKISELKSRSADEVAEVTYTNAERLFKW